MLSIHDAPVRLCDGLSRRAVLRAGGLGLLGLTWPACQARGLAAAHRRADAPARACIVLFLMGGPPQHSTWDPKPEAPPEIRGDFPPIATAVPGVQFCELLPRLARRSDRLAVLRAVATDDNAHSSSGYAMLTGHPHQPLNRENANPGPPNDRPTLGAIVQHLGAAALRPQPRWAPGRGESRILPAAVRLPMHIFNTDQSVWPGQDSGFLGHGADPWLFRFDPAAEAEVADFHLAADVTLGRLENRRSLLSQLEGRLAGAGQSGAPDAYDDQRRQAFDLLSSPKGRHALNLEREPPQIRDRYGRTPFGQSVLLARRLVEAGVAFVHVNWYRGPDEPSENPVWDTHANETERLKNVLVPPMDQAFAALLDDLEERGLLDETLVVCVGEFGRTPRFNARAGRDHWGHCFPAALAGGGVQGGRVHGASDKAGAWPREGRVGPADVAATIFHCLGYDPSTEIHDPAGRPYAISGGRVIHEVL